MVEEVKDDGDKGDEKLRELKRELEELKKELEELKRQKGEGARSELLKETSRVLRRVDVAGFGILAALADGIGNLVELAEKVQDPKNPFHKKLKVEYAIKTSGLLGDRYITRGGDLVPRPEGKAPEPVERSEERRRIMKEIKELRKLKEQFLKAEQEPQKEERENPESTSSDL